MQSLVPVERIERLILLIRGQKVIVDVDIASLYGVTTKALNQAVRRNIARFPSDFMFQLMESERDELVTNCDRFKNLKHSTVLPNAFTEYGAVMLANILRSKRAVDMSVYVVRAFIRLREIVLRNQDLAKKIGELEQRIAIHDKAIQSLFSAIRALMTPPENKKRKIGFDLKTRD